DVGSAIELAHAVLVERALEDDEVAKTARVRFSLEARAVRPVADEPQTGPPPAPHEPVEGCDENVLRLGRSEPTDTEDLEGHGVVAKGSGLEDRRIDAERRH